MITEAERHYSEAETRVSEAEGTKQKKKEYQIIERRNGLFTTVEEHYTPRSMTTILAEEEKREHKGFTLFRSFKVTNVVIVGNNTTNIFRI